MMCYVAVVGGGGSGSPWWEAPCNVAQWARQNGKMAGGDF